MRKAIYAFLTITLLISATAANAQKDKSWNMWSKKDAEKMLNDSPWAQTQTDTDTSEMFFSPTKPGTSSIGQSTANRTIRTNDQQSINNNRADQGATNQAISVNYHVRFFSAKPVRQAIVRAIELQQHTQNEQLGETLRPLIDRDFGQYIVLTVTFDSTDGRFSGQALQAFNSAVAEILKVKTYLERKKDGKRLFLIDYRAPSEDGLGAKFVFPRMVDGKPFLDVNSGSVRFVSEIGDKIKLNVTYKLSEMMYDGKLEY